MRHHSNIASLDENKHHASENNRSSAGNVEIHDVAAGLGNDELSIGYRNGSCAVCGSILHPCAVADGSTVGGVNGNRDYFAVYVITGGSFGFCDVVGTACELQFLALRIEEGNGAVCIGCT